MSKGKISGPGARVIAVNAKTGALLWATQVDRNPAAQITGSPVIYKGIVYTGVSSEEETFAEKTNHPCCTFQGSAVALDLRTGKILWQTYDMPPNGGRPGGYSGGAIWNNTPAIDPKRNSIYVGTGNNYRVPPDVASCIVDAIHDGESDSVCNNVDQYERDSEDSIIALDLNTGTIKWAHRLEGYDAWTVACESLPPGVGWCPSPEGKDYDLGTGANFFTTQINGKRMDVIGKGQKSGIYWALNPDNGRILWSRLVGPGSINGGIEWGTATDCERVYATIANIFQIPYRLQPSGVSIDGGSWSAINAATGKLLWQTAVPGSCNGLSRTHPDQLSGHRSGCMALGPPTVANGVVFESSMDINPADPTMFALDASTREILWSFMPGSSVNAGPAVVGDSIYWGSGYSEIGNNAGDSLGTGNNKLFAFSLNGKAGK